MSVDQARARAVRAMWIKRLRALVLLAVPAVLMLSLEPIRDYVGTNAFAIGWALCSAIVGLSMNVLVGYAGQISLAHAVLFGTGGYAIGHLTSSLGLPWLVAIPLSGLITAVVALLIGFPALRVRGLNLAILTLGFQFVMQRTVFHTESIGGGAAGVKVARPRLFGLGTQATTDFLWVIIAGLVLIWMIDRGLTRSRAGRAFFAIRQDEQVAASVGIPVARYKLLAFAISGFYAGIAGGLFGTLVETVVAEPFDYPFSFEFLVFAVLGGLGSRPGTAIGAAFPVLYRSLLTIPSGPALGGLLLVVTLLRYPGGIAAQGREVGHVSRELARRGLRYFFGFLGALVLSIGAAFLVPIAFDRLLGVFGGGLTSFPSILIGLGALTYGSQTAIKQLFRISARRAKPHTAPVISAPASTLALREPRRPATGPLLEVVDLAIRFGGVRALDGVSLEVRAGELIGIMGPNGSGKTTMLNNISGFLTPNSGDIRFRGESILDLEAHERAGLGLGRTFQNIGLVKQETVFDNFVIAQHLVCNYGAMEGIIRTGAVASEERRLRRRAAAAIEMLKLGDIAHEQVRALPHGRAKLVELGCALVTDPELLLLDEPAAGVSPQEADELGETLKRIAANFGVTILMIEHHVPLMLNTCDYIYVLNFGQLLTHGLPADVARHPDVIAAYLGTVGKEASLAATGSH